MSERGGVGNVKDHGGARSAGLGVDGLGPLLETAHDHDRGGHQRHQYPRDYSELVQPLLQESFGDSRLPRFNLCIVICHVPIRAGRIRDWNLGLRGFLAAAADLRAVLEYQVLVLRALCAIDVPSSQTAGARLVAFGLDLFARIPEDVHTASTVYGIVRAPNSYIVRFEFLL